MIAAKSGCSYFFYPPNHVQIWAGCITSFPFCKLITIQGKVFMKILELMKSAAIQNKNRYTK